MEPDENSGKSAAGSGYVSRKSLRYWASTKQRNALPAKKRPPKSRSKFSGYGSSSLCLQTWGDPSAESRA